MRWVLLLVPLVAWAEDDDFHAARVWLEERPLAEGAPKRARTSVEFGEFAKTWCRSEACAGRDDGRELSCTRAK